jgi:hypothetical protein
MGPLNWLLGIEIHRDREKRTIAFSQKAYIDAIIEKYGFANTKTLSVPADPHIQLTKDQLPQTSEDILAMSKKPYAEAVGSLNYASIATRPDITFIVGRVAEFNSNPGMAHWNVVKCIFQYLKGTNDLWLVLGQGEELTFAGYSDADGNSTEGRSPIMGYVFFLAGGTISWSSKRESLVTLSTTEPEYVALTHAAKEALWLQSFYDELFGKKQIVKMMSDNQGAIALGHDDKFHVRTKHIDICFHFIRQCVENGKVTLVYCPTDDMTADILTKALPSMKQKHFAHSLGLMKV